MKKRFLFLAIVMIFSLQFFYADSIDVFVGGGLTGYLLPSVNYNSVDSTIKIPGTPFTASVTTTDKIENVNLLFGFGIAVPVGVIYNFNNGWGVGGLLEVGYSLQGGPQVYRKDKPDDYVVTDYTYLYNAFLGVINVVGRTPDLGHGFRINMELGAIVRPGAVLAFEKTKRLDFPISASGTLNYRVLCYAGPNLFIGFQKELAKSLVIMPGLRISAEFAEYDLTVTNYILKEFYMQANFGLEFRILWDYNIALKK